MSSIELVNNEYSNDNAKKDLKKFGLEDEFDYPKPVALIRRLISSYFKKDAVVLDFFAGSGTTAQAVLELNMLDGGTRSFILCTNNQNDICRNVTLSRCRQLLESYEFEGLEKTLLAETSLTLTKLKSMSKVFEELKAEAKDYESDYSTTKFEIDGSVLKLFGIRQLPGTKGLNASLTFYSVDYLDVSDLVFDEYADDLLDTIQPLCDLYAATCRVSGEGYVVLFDEDEVDEFVSNLNKDNLVSMAFMARDVLCSSAQKDAFDEYGVATFVVPDFFYNEEMA